MPMISLLPSVEEEEQRQEESDEETEELHTSLAISILRPTASLSIIKLHLLRSSFLATQLAVAALKSFVPAFKTSMSSSVLSGNLWIHSVLYHDNERYAQEIFGLGSGTFVRLCDELELVDGRSICRELQLAIFLLIVRGGLHLRLLVDRVQTAKDTSSKYFRLVLERLVDSEGFYTRHVRMPTLSPATPSFVRRDHRFAGYFDNCVGAVDGTHVPIFRKTNPSDSNDIPDWGSFRDRHGNLTWSALVVCDFDLQFMYVLPGFEGAAHDSKLWDFAIHKDLCVPEGRWLLGDNGFPLCDEILTPYIGVRYQLQEWLRFVQRNSSHRLLVQDYAELFNLRHASAMNVVERTFGILKRRFGILNTAPEYAISVQAVILPALCALHNFLRSHNSFSIETDLAEVSQDQTLQSATALAGVAFDDDDSEDQEPEWEDRGSDGRGESSRQRLVRCQELRDQLAERMWSDYCRSIRNGPRERIG